MHYHYMNVDRQRETFLLINFSENNIQNMYFLMKRRKDLKNCKIYEEQKGQ